MRIYVEVPDGEVQDWVKVYLQTPGVTTLIQTVTMASNPMEAVQTLANFVNQTLAAQELDRKTAAEYHK